MDTSVLKKIFLFSELNQDHLEVVGKISRVKKYNKGDIIFFDTEPYLGFYVVLKGMVKIYKISKDGREHIVHLVDMLNTFAEVPLFENAGEILEKEFKYPANAMAIEDNTEVMLLPARPFIQLIETTPKLSIKMISGFAKRLRHLNNHIEVITLKDVTKRVAGYILNEYKSNQRKSNIPEEKQNIISLKISKNDLASYLGTILETLSRTFRKLHDDGIIEVEGKNIVIKDLRKLKGLSM
ncbi:MAG: Crp/Fnr family transcriptional regulator [Ignavibacteriae bacterium]|nr:MAG: Crp/Fnr family transcriptional regulator [Ignavibacteriota bacterium]